jgi:hypothetical protein
VVARLENVDGRDPALHEHLLDVRLGIPGQEKPPALVRAEQDDRCVVHGRPVVRGLRRDTVGVGPEDVDGDAVEHEPVPGRQPHRGRAARGQAGDEGFVPGAAPRHPGLRDPPHAVPLEHERESRHVVLVRVREDDEV